MKKIHCSRRSAHHSLPAALALLLVCPALTAQSPAETADDDAADRTAALEIAGTRFQRIETQANTFTASTQDAVALDVGPGGETLVAWHSRRQEEGTYGVFARLFGPDGAPAGEELHLNLTTQSMQTRPSVALDATGGAWIAWSSHGQDGDAGAIVARRLHPATGSPEEAGKELLVNTQGAGHQSDVVLDCDVAGNAVLVWCSPLDGSPGRHVFARRFSAHGTARGEPFRVDSRGGVGNGLPCVEMDAAGGFVVLWARTDLAGRPTGIVARRFDAAGEALGAEREVAADGLHIEPALSVAPDGSIAAAWLTASGEDYEIRLRRFDAETESWGAARRLAGDAPGYTSGLAVSLRDDGRCLVAWSAFGDAERKSDFWARLYDRANEPLGASFRVTGAESGHQKLQPATGTRRVVCRADGGMAFAWTGNSGGGDGSAANLTLLLPEEQQAARQAAPGAELLAALSRKPETPRPHDPPAFDPSRVIDRSALPESSLTSSTGFLGIVSTGWTPPDPHMAAGPSNLVLITNGAIAFFDKDGTMTFQDEIEGGSGFWGAQGATGFVFDPEVLWDPHSSRFMAMANERASDNDPYFLLAVSDDADPNGTWHKYRFNVRSESGDTDIDSPNMGVDSQAVYLTADFFGPDKYLVYIVEKAPMLTGGTPSTRHLLITGEQSIGIPVTYGTAPAQYMIGAFESSSNNLVKFHAITDPLGTPQRQTVTLSVPTYEYPEDPPQMGTSTRPELFEPRFWSCVYRNGYLWATHHQGASRVTQRWYQFDMASWPTSGTPSLVQSGDIDLGGDLRTFFGSIWADAQNNMSVLYARSSPSEFISMGRASRLASDALGTTPTTEVLQTSSGADSTGRWGDYSCTVSDPADAGIFWGHHEYRHPSGFWATWVARFDTLPEPLSYCTGKTNSLGCVPYITTAGRPSVSGTQAFSIIAEDTLTGVPGILLYGYKKASLNYHGGKLCVKSPFRRWMPAKTSTTGGSLPCPGSLSRNFNNRIQSGADPLLTAGGKAYAQWHYRDGADPAGFADGLTNGVKFTIAP